MGVECSGSWITAAPNDLADLGEVEYRLLGFQRRHEQTAVPVAWRFTLGRP